MGSCYCWGNFTLGSHVGLNLPSSGFVRRIRMLTRELGMWNIEEAGMGPEAGADADTISIKVLPDGYHLWMESSRKEFKHCEVVYQTTSGLPPTTGWECHLRSLSWKIKAINYALILKPCVWVAYLSPWHSRTRCTSLKNRTCSSKVMTMQ